MRILVAEDDRGLQEILALGLRDAGYHVDAVDRGDDAIDQLRWYEYDVAIVDWRMPGAEGIDVVAWARKNDRPTAILMLTARDTPADRIRGLDTGADDYLVKPFDFGELLARVRALQRRPRGVDQPVLVLGALSLDPVSHVVAAGGSEVSLTNTEYLILELLMRRAPAVVDRKAIAEHAWADETDPLGSNAIDVQMSRLRAKLVGAGRPHRHGARDGVPGGAGMSGAQSHEVRRTSIRVALAATILVAAAYTVIAFAVVAIVTQNLTAQIDDRLVRSLEHVPQQGFPGGGGFEPPPGDRPFGPQTLSWTIKADGTVVTGSTSIPDLPVEYRAVTSPRTVTIDGTEMRVAGAPAGAASGGDYVVVGQTLDAVSEAQATILRAELIIGPILLLVVFLGAIAIGRRVAAPIERARQRQLEFTADASHELRTPLAVIEANTSLALAQDRSAEWYRAAFVRVDGESRRMRRLLEDLLWLARFDAAQAPPAAEPVDLGILVAGTADRFAAVAETRGLRIAVHAPDGAVVAAPPDWIDRLVGVLLDNACKYSPDGGTVDVTVDATGGRTRLIVDDSGPGIPEAERELIFDRFHRATDSENGAGLGLAIADAIVRATGARWSVATSPAGGARMSVSVAARGRDEPPGGSRGVRERVTVPTGTAAETAVHGHHEPPPHPRCPARPRRLVRRGRAGTSSRPPRPRAPGLRRVRPAARRSSARRSPSRRSGSSRRSRTRSSTSGSAGRWRRRRRTRSRSSSPRSATPPRTGA